VLHQSVGSVDAETGDKVLDDGTSGFLRIMRMLVKNLASFIGASERPPLFTDVHMLVVL
jgi:hypothetical protein